ncbi:nitroreductase family protein [Microbacterium sp. P06]|uniref:nitroreductase family protein n=1 Tax=unclassified Microbacterium TaxID=2609290 RepID=UPI0037450792
MSMDTATDRVAQTATPILPVLAERWSPRSFVADEAIDEQKLTAALEAARWSSSAANTQPWRFIVARRGSESFARIVSSLKGFNSVWADAAGALVVAAYEVTGPEGEARPWAQYDLGQAMAHFSVQAHGSGLHVHTMGGFDADALAETFALPENIRPLTVTAVGALAPAERLADEALIARESAPRVRRPLSEIVLVDE